MSSVIGGTAWTLTMTMLSGRLPRNSNRLNAYAARIATSSVSAVHGQRDDVAVDEEPQLHRGR